MRKKSEPDLEDDLRPEYDLRTLRVVARGPGRKGPAEVNVLLDADVAEFFPDADAVNQALRFLLRVTRKHVG
jgi:hypothetical protein